MGLGQAVAVLLRPVYPVSAGYQRATRAAVPPLLLSAEAVKP